MTVEELLFKMGIDSSGLEQGLRKAKVQLAGFKEESEKTFLHAGSAARAFHKNLEALNEAVPGLGTALQFALNPVTGILAGIALGFGYAKKKLEEYNQELDKTAEKNAKPIFGQDQVDKLKGKQRELIDDQKEWQRQLTEGDPIKKLTDSINQQTTATGKLAQTAKVLPELYKDYGQALKDANEAAVKHTKLQEGLAKGPANLAEAQRQLDDLRKRGPEKPEVQLNGPTFGPASGQYYVEQQRKVEEERQTKVQQYNRSIQVAIDNVNKARQAIADHEDEERKTSKELSEYRKKTEKAREAIESVAGEQKKLAETTKNAQALYDLKIGQLLQKQTEEREAPYKSGSLSELGQYNTPYGQIAREIGLARNASKFLGAQMSPQDMAQVQQQILGVQGEARADLAAAGNDPQKRASAISKYGRSLEDILTGKGVNPEARHLESIQNEIKDFNARSKLGSEGLVIRGPDS